MVLRIAFHIAAIIIVMILSGYAKVHPACEFYSLNFNQYLLTIDAFVQKKSPANMVGLNMLVNKKYYFTSSGSS